MKNFLLLPSILLTVLTSNAQVYRLSAYQTNGYIAATKQQVLNTPSEYTIYISTELGDVAIENYYGESIEVKIRRTSIENGDPIFECEDAYGNWYIVTLGEGILTIDDPNRQRTTRIKYR